MKQKEKSIHFCTWPKYDAKKIDKKLEQNFDLILRIIEAGLAVRDKEGIGLKWPLSRAVISLDKKIDKSILDIISRQLNVKNIVIKKGKEFSVKLDTKLTPELEAEGFAREISRRVQSERKKKGLERKDTIELQLWVGSELKETLQPHLEFIKQRTSSKNVKFVDGKMKGMIKFKIKSKEIGIIF